MFHKSSANQTIIPCHAHNSLVIGTICLFLFTRINTPSLLDLLSRLPLDHDEPDRAGHGGDGEDQQLPAEAEPGGDQEPGAHPHTLHQLDQGEGLGAVVAVLAAHQGYHL